MPNPAMAPYSVSASAAPKPETMPDFQPFSRVRRMQRRLTGPTGAAMIRPATSPRIGNSRSIAMALDSGIEANRCSTRRAIFLPPWRPLGDSAEDVLGFLEPVGADDEDIERKAEAAERLVEPHSLIQSVGRRRGEDEQVDIAVASHLPGGRGAEEDDPVSRTKLSSMPINHMMLDARPNFQLLFTGVASPRRIVQ